MFGFLFACLVVLALVTVIGHGIWVGIGRIVFGEPGDSKSVRPPSTNCPRCESRLSNGHCRVCRWPLSDHVRNHSQNALEELRRQLKKFADLGLIDRATFLSLDAKFVAELTPAPAPVATAPLSIVSDDMVQPEISESAELPVLEESVPAVPITPAPTPSIQPIARPVITPEERVREYVARQTELATDVAPPAPPPPPPKRAWTDLLAAFMEEKNIRWGELVGGLLIVCCSIALVISFWSKIAERPFLKFFVFNSVTAALFGLGLYSERRWKLRTTSDGLLIIASLLVPLNFLSIAAFTQGAAAGGTFTILGELISMALFAALLWQAARILVPIASWQLVVGTLVPSALLLLARRLVESEGTSVAAEAIGFGLLGLQAAMLGTSVRNVLFQKQEPTERELSFVFKLLGITAFATSLAIGFIVYRIGDVGVALHRLSPLLTCAGLVPLGVGLAVWRRAISPAEVAYRTAGLAIAVAGAMLLVAGVVEAWPEPLRLMLTCGIAATTLLIVAFLFNLPQAHFVAIPCLVLTALIAWHTMRGHLTWRTADASQSVTALVSGESGQVLTPLALAIVALGFVLNRLRRAADAKFFILSAFGIAAVSVGMVSWFGFGRPGDPLFAIWIYAIYAVTALWIAHRRSSLAALCAAAGLLFAAIVQKIVFGSETTELFAMPWTAALIADALVMALMAAALTQLRDAARREMFVPALNAGAKIVSIFALTLLIVSVGGAIPAGVLFPYWIAISAVWLVVAWVGTSPIWFSMFQLGLASAVLFGVAARLQRTEWFYQAPHPWLDPRTLLAEGIALGLYCIPWIFLRQGRNREPLLRLKANRLLAAAGPTVESVLLRLILISATAVAVYAALPGVAQELSPRLAMPGATLTTRVVPPIEAFEIAAIPHGVASGFGMSIWLTVLSIAFIAEMWARKALRNVIVLLMIGMLVCPLLARGWQSEVATASALRWLSAGYFLLASIVIWNRHRFARLVTDFSRTATSTTTALIALTVTPPIAATLCVLAMVLGQDFIVGPDPGSWFSRIGLSTSYAGPFLIIAIAFVGYGIREQSARFAFAGGVIVNFAVTAAYLLSIGPGNLLLDLTQWIRLAQFNAIAAAGYVLVWMAVRSVLRQPDLRSEFSKLLVTQICIPVALNLLILVPTWIAIFWDPWLSSEFAAIGDWRGWLSAGLSIAAVIAFCRVAKTTITPHATALALVALGTLTAASVGADRGLPWVALHTLLLFHIGLSAAALIGGWFFKLSLSGWRLASRAASLTLAFAVALALRALWGDPHAPWWSAASLLAVATIIACFAAASLRRGLLHFAAAAISLAALGWWFHEGTKFIGTGTFFPFAFGAIQVFVISLALPAVVWLFIERRVFQPAAGLATKSALPPMHRLAARFSLVVFLLLLGVGLLADINGDSGVVRITGQWLALAAVIIAALCLLWDAGATDSVAMLYLAGLLAAGTLLDSLDLRLHWLQWLGTITLAAYGLLTSYLWSCRTGLRSLADRVGIPRGEERPFAHLGWLVPVNCLLATVVVVLVFAIELTYAELSLRVMAAKAVIAVAIAVGLLARGERRSQLQFGALALGTLAVIALTWAPLNPATEGSLLNRSVAVAAALAITTVLYGLGLGKLLSTTSEWLHAARRMVPVLVALAAGTLVFILGTEIAFFAANGVVPMSPLAILLVMATLLGLSAASLAAAILPGRDPIGLTERGRRIYVYAAEILLALGFLHIRLTMPWLFHGWFERFWPIIVMVIAFLGAGVGEWFRRRKLTVLGDPLENTGALLPMLPVMAFWFIPTQVDYSLLLLAVGLLYAGLSVARKSFGFGVLAALSANGGLWYFLNRMDGYRLLEHPQIWLIPPAVCVLIASHINRRQLTPDQTTAIRYGASVMIYVSSTADIFLNGVAQEPWLPLILAGLALGGIFAGILMRIRAFLFMGIAFLVLALLTIIWHAAVDLEQTWLWYAAGIVVGILIIAVFAIFEKKRDQMLRVLDDLKQWQP